eukprot:13334809-Alexandrium_andersonii.AAC.1
MECALPVRRNVQASAVACAADHGAGGTRAGLVPSAPAQCPILRWQHEQGSGLDAIASRSPVQTGQERVIT